MKTLIVLYSLVCAGVANCQSVDSTAFNNMLDSLLSHTVNEVKVNDIDTADHRIQFIDTRELEEYETSHIQNSIWVGYNDFSLNRLGSINKNSPIVLYCSVGYRSEKIGETLLKNGYTNVSNLYGGIFEWSNQCMPIYDNTQTITTSVHAYNEEWSQWLLYGVKIF
jgi:rhodanese-related sulfurtransferase